MTLQSNATANERSTFYDANCFTEFYWTKAYQSSDVTLPVQWNSKRNHWSVILTYLRKGRSWLVKAAFNHTSRSIGRLLPPPGEWRTSHVLFVLRSVVYTGREQQIGSPLGGSTDNRSGKCGHVAVAGIEFEEHWLGYLLFMWRPTEAQHWKDLSATPETRFPPNKHGVSVYKPEVKWP